MTAIASSPAELLFSNAEGKPTSLEDLDRRWTRRRVMYDVRAP